MKERSVYSLSKEFDITPEEVAVAMAKTSRSPLSFRENAGEISAEKAAKFHDKYVMAYNHASVAELATVDVCLEGISMLAAKALEDNRLGSYIEASTRYQIWDADSWVTPPEIREDDELLASYKRSQYRLFQRYLKAMPIVQEKLREITPKPDEMSDSLYATNIKAKACDLLRGMLPAAATTNVGFVANARTMAHAVQKLLSSDLLEMRQMGAELKETALQSLPTLIKYASGNGYRIIHSKRMRDIAKELVAPHTLSLGARPGVNLQAFYDLRLLHVKILTNALYPHTNRSYGEIFWSLKNLSEDRIHDLWLELFIDRSAHDQTPRALEDATFTFDTIMDFGAWRDLQRHRMMTQFDQPLSIDLGYAIPDQIREFGLADYYADTIDHIPALYAHMSHDFGPMVAQYVVPMCYYKRSVMTMNLRQLHALVELRTKPGGHLAYRRIARQMYDAVQQRYPILVQHLRVSDVEMGDDLKRIKEVKS